MTANQSQPHNHPINIYVLNTPLGTMPINMSAATAVVPLIASFHHLQQLKALSEIDRDLLFPYGTVQSFDANEEIVSRGQILDSVHWILSGVLVAHCCSSETRVLLGQRVIGDTIGEISVMDPGRTTVTVQAVEEGQMFSIKRHDLDRYIEDHPVSGNHILKHLATQLARRLRYAKEQLIRESEGRFGFGNDY